MTTEELIEEILSACPEISRGEILGRLERQKRKTDGLVSDDTLLRLVAVEFGVKILLKNSLLPSLSIRDLIPSLGDISIVGRVVAVFSPKTFSGTRSGKFASLFIADVSGMLRVVLWNDKASLIESGAIKVEQIVRLSRGYTREDREGKVELNVGEKSGIEVNPSDVDEKDYPTISKFATRIGEINPAFKNKTVNVIGAVKELFSASTFRRRDLSAGKVMRFVLADETGAIPVVAWNDKVDELEESLTKGIELQIVNAKVKGALGEGLEIHVNARTYVGKSLL